MLHAPTMLPPCSLTLLDNRAGFHIEGRGRPVVLLHSSMGSKGQWRALVERMRRSHRLIAIDLHGYGSTPMPALPNTFTLQHEVVLIESVLRVGLLPGERFHLVGHSYGAAVALRIAQARPQRLHSLTVFEPVALNLLPDTHPGRLELECVRDEMLHWSGRGEPLRGAERFIDYWNGEGAFAQLPPNAQQTLAKLVPKAALDLVAASRETLRADDCRRITAPTCLLSGTSGPKPPHDVLDVLAAVLPQARRQRVPAGHMAPVTHPDLVNPVIDTFVRGLDALRLRPAALQNHAA
jgi:pimeloyl-ACP methyl ester carboxylesterase